VCSAVRASAGEMSECIVFLAHHTEPGAMAALQKLRDECSSRFELVPIFDQTRKAFPVEHIPNARVVNCKQVTRALPYREKHREHKGTFWPRNIELPLLAFFLENPSYTHYWLMEYDVRFTGHWWSEFFQHFAANRSDLLATTLFDYEFRPDWDNWQTLRSPRHIAESARTRALLSLCRLSNKALQVIHEAYTEGWTGHYEVTIPTILKTSGLILEDVGGNGKYVAPGNTNRFYRNSPERAGLAPGTFTVAPNTLSSSEKLLWHPIKG
jgi:hypothetical protein